MKKVIIVAIIACIVILGCSIYKSCAIKEYMTTEDALKYTNEYITNLETEIAEKEELKTEKEAEKANIESKQAKLLSELTSVQTNRTEEEAKPVPDKTKIEGYDLIIQQLLVDNKTLINELATLNKLLQGIPPEIQRLKIEKERRETSKTYYQDPSKPTMPADETTDDIAIVQDESGKLVGLESSGTLGGSPTYYTPGSYKFGASTYVPSYQDSVLLSKTTGKYSAAEYLNESSLMKGSCEYYKDQPAKLEQACLNVDKKNCSSMSCCVLLGGSKCVSGDEKGPTDTRNYGDKTLKNKDYYYHSGKCYGNCN